ncbi:hypothetical protein Tco_0402634, partial [Tanacetum coccineum]
MTKRLLALTGQRLNATTAIEEVILLKNARPRNQGNKNRDAPRRNALLDISTTNALVVQDGIVSSSSDSE